MPIHNLNLRDLQLELKRNKPVYYARWIFWVLLVGVIAYLVYDRAVPDSAAAGGPAAASGGGPGFEALSARVYIAQAEPLAERVGVSGSLLANEEVALTSEAAGKVTGIFFREGAYVKKGQLLVQLNDAELKAQLAQAHSRLDLLIAQEARQKQLLEQGAVSQNDYDIAASNLLGARAQIDLIKAQLAQTRIVAPFNGTIGLRQVAVGSYISPGVVIATLQNLDIIKIQFSVPEVYASNLQPGSEVDFTVRGSSRTFSARVFAVEPKIDPQTRSLVVRAQTRNPGKLVPGAYADVSLVLSVDGDAILVPSQCVVTEAAGQLVFRVKNGVVTPTPVTLGARGEQYVHVQEGLSVGDTVMVSGILQARPDRPVLVTEVQTGPLAGTTKTDN